MNVLMINTFHHRRGGDATYTAGLTRLLTQAGVGVTPLAMRHPDNEPSVWEHRFVSWVDLRAPAGSPLDQARLAARMFWSREAAQATARLIAEVRPDVAHLGNVHRHLTPSVLGPLRRAGIPVAWTVHDYELVCPQGHLFRDGRPCEACRGHQYQAAIQHRCKWGQLGPSVAAAAEKVLHHRMGVWHKVDRFLCPSRFLADTLTRFGVPAERIHHQPNFLDLAPLAPPPGPGKGWLYAGRLTQEKGVDVAIDAARALAGHTLHICGTGPAETALRERARGLPQVRFHGHLDRVDLARLIQEVAVAVVPSRWYENFPYAVLEAQAAGRAVVASRIGGIPEQISDGIDGRLVPADDVQALQAAVGPLLADPGAALRLGLAGAARVRATLTPERHLRAILDHYRAIAPGARIPEV